jgi:hypothetical protein
MVAGCAGRDVPSLVDETDRFAEALAAAKRYADAAVVAEPAFEAAGSGGWPHRSKLLLPVCCPGSGLYDHTSPAEGTRQAGDQGCCGWR